METTKMTEKDAERWATIARLHAESGVADADTFWVEGNDELCANFQSNEYCQGCPVRDFTGRANCAGAWHWYLWVDTVDAYLALKNENEGHEIGPILNDIAAKAAGEHGKMLATLAEERRRVS